MHSLDACDDDLGTPKRLESQLGLGDSFYGPVIPFDDVVQELVLSHQDVNTGVRLEAFNGRSIGTALVYGDLLRWDMKVGGTLQKMPECGLVPLGSEKKVNRISSAISRGMLRTDIEALASQPGTSQRAPGRKVYPYLHLSWPLTAPTRSGR